MQEREAVLRPRRLRRGGTVGICSPSGPVMDPDTLERCIEWWREEGFEVRLAPHARSRHGFLAGTDEQRLADLLELWRDPRVDAVVSSRGGYGLMRLLGRLPAAELRGARKLFIGHSDATALLLYLRRCAGLASLHGPMLQRSDWSPESRARLLDLACGGAEFGAPLHGKGVRGGRASGPLVGGNLTLLTASLGTPWEVDTRGAILFIEDISEPPYSLDRHLAQLRAAGKLEAAAAVAVGQLVDCESHRYPDVTSRDVIDDMIAAAVPGAAVVDLPFGHTADNRALPVGTLAEVDATAGTLTLLEPVVEMGD
jgi:muramoyltetrapeptide carboxypeptidase